MRFDLEYCNLLPTDNKFNLGIIGMSGQRELIKQCLILT